MSEVLKVAAFGIGVVILVFAVLLGLWAHVWSHRLDRHYKALLEHVASLKRNGGDGR